MLSENLPEKIVAKQEEQPDAQKKLENMLSWSKFGTLNKDEWKATMELMNFTKPSILAGIIKDNQTISDPAQMAREITLWGSEKWYDKYWSHNDTTIQRIIEKHVSSESVQFSPEDIYNELYDMDKHSAFGMDMIPLSLFKDMPNYATHYNHLVDERI